MTIISYKNNYKNHKNFPPVEWVRMTDDDIEKHVYVLVYTQNNPTVTSYYRQPLSYRKKVISFQGVEQKRSVNTPCYTGSCLNS